MCDKNKIKSKKLRVVYFPEAEIIHYGGNSSNSEVFKINQIIISYWLEIRKIKGRIYFIFYCKLLLINFLIDDLFYFCHKFLNSLLIQDKAEKQRRILQKKLFKKYFWTILFKYKRKNSSAKTFLKYDIEKLTRKEFC